MKKFLLLFVFLLSQLSFAQSDCSGAITVCGNSGLSYTPSGFGIQEISSSNSTCGFYEVNSVWYTFTVATAGTLTFQITPNVTTNDYDFYLFGPNATCSNLGTSIRCSVAVPLGGLTGLNMTSTVASDPVGGSGFAQFLNVLPGQTYYLCVNNFSPVTQGFTLTWGGTATLASPFSNTALAPNPFIAPGPNQNGHVQICLDPQIFDFSTLTPGIINGNPNFHVTYHTSVNNVLTNTAPITTPINVNTTTTYYYAIRYTNPTDPNDPNNKCFNTGTLNFDSGAITVNNATINACNNNNVGIGTFNLTSAAVYNGTATIQYYPSVNDANAGTNQITNPTAYTSQPGNVYALVTTPLGCTNIATITLAFHPLPIVNAITLTACNNNNAGQAYYDLTTANVSADPNATKKYFPSINDLLNGTNEITNPQYYLSAQGQIYVEVTSSTNGCKNYNKITLNFYPAINVKEVTLTKCFLAGSPTKGEFDLTVANISTTAPITKKYYPSMQDAINDTNAIANPTNHISPETTIYVRVIDSNNCWNVAQIHLKVTSPAYSPVLLDKTICVEGRTTLDAGSGFSGYQWSTGATTQSITNVSVGEYWVDLTKDGCVTRQTVKVYASPSPIITNLEITNKAITVTVTGGVPPHEFSLDGINWQTSNIFTNVPRGQAVIYVRDSFKCVPIMIAVTVPNLVNAITPNDDNINDYLDYSALAFKKNLTLTIYDRYGTPIHTADKKNNYRWDGRVGSNKLSTGNYWYTITWTEPETDILVKYSGWVMVKNRQ